MVDEDVPNHAEQEDDHQPSHRRLIGRFHPLQYRTKGGAMLAAYAGAMK